MVKKFNTFIFLQDESFTNLFLQYNRNNRRKGMMSSIKMDRPISIVSGRLRKLNKAERIRYPLYKYVTVDPHQLYIGNLSITIPAGFLTDGSSGGPDYGRSWLFHDWLYATHSFDEGVTTTREQADWIMSEVLQHEQIYWYCNLFVFFAKVNPFWAFSRAWATSGARGAEYFEEE